MTIESRILSREYPDNPDDAPEALDCEVCRSERTVEFTGIDPLHGRAEFTCSACGDTSFIDLWDLGD
jgi:transcription elongation factor Elf1